MSAMFALTNSPLIQRQNGLMFSPQQSLHYLYNWSAETHNYSEQLRTYQLLSIVRASEWSVPTVLSVLPVLASVHQTVVSVLSAIL